MHSPTGHTSYNIHLPDYVGGQHSFKLNYPYFEFTPIRQAIKELIDEDI